MYIHATNYIPARVWQIMTIIPRTCKWCPHARACVHIFPHMIHIGKRQGSWRVESKNWNLMNMRVLYGRVGTHPSLWGDIHFYIVHVMQKCYIFWTIYFWFCLGCYKHRMKEDEYVSNIIPKLLDLIITNIATLEQIWHYYYYFKIFPHFKKLFIICAKSFIN